MGIQRTNQIIIGIDPGLKGGITILEGDKEPLIYKIPLQKIVVNKKKKNTYDMISIVDIFKRYKSKKVLFYIEQQSVRRGEGSVSAMTIGVNFGKLLGAAYAFEFNVIIVSPQTWKKCFPELITDEMLGIKAEMKELRLIGKTLEDKEQKKENKKYIEKLGRNFKSLAKTEARKSASSRCPELSGRFEKKNTDGLAESLLIAIYGELQELQK
jgi:hypothetical protein